MNFDGPTAPPPPPPTLPRNRVTGEGASIFSQRQVRGSQGPTDPRLTTKLANVFLREVMLGSQVGISVPKTAQALSTDGAQTPAHMHAHMMIQRCAATVGAGAHLTDEPPARESAGREGAIRAGCAKRTGPSEKLDSHK